MVKARWNLYFDCRRCFWDWHDDTNAAHFHSKRLHIWFHFVVTLINIPVIHMTCHWFTGTISAGTVIPNACFRWKTNGTPATAEVNNRETAAQTSERSILFSDNHLVEAPVPAVGQSTLAPKSLQTCKLCSWCSWFLWGCRAPTFLVRWLTHYWVSVLDLIQSVRSKRIWGICGSGQRVIQECRTNLSGNFHFITIIRI